MISETYSRPKDQQKLRFLKMELLEEGKGHAQSHQSYLLNIQGYAVEMNIFPEDKPPLVELEGPKDILKELRKTYNLQKDN